MGSKTWFGFTIGCFKKFEVMWFGLFCLETCTGLRVNRKHGSSDKTYGVGQSLNRFEIYAYWCADFMCSLLSVKWRWQEYILLVETPPRFTCQRARHTVNLQICSVFITTNFIHITWIYVFNSEDKGILERTIKQ